MINLSLVYFFEFFFFFSCWEKLWQQQQGHDLYFSTYVFLFLLNTNVFQKLPSDEAASVWNTAASGDVLYENCSIKVY